MASFDFSAPLSPGEVPKQVAPKAAAKWEENHNYKLMCPECQEDPPFLVEEFASGDMVCGSCGLVLQNHIIDNRSEWRTFSNDDQGNDDPSRVGEAANPLLHGSQLSTEIASSRDSRFKELSRAHNRSNEHKGNKSLLAAYQIISSVCERLNTSSNIASHAKLLYKIIDESKQFRSMPVEVLTAVCVFVALRRENAGRSFKEVNRIARVPKKELGRTYKMVAAYLKDYSDANPTAPAAPGSAYSYQATTSTGPKEMCNRFGSALDLPPQVYYMAGECADLMLTDGPLAGRSPLSVAALALYAISGFMGMPKTSKEVGEVCGVSDGTIRGTWRKIYVDRARFIKPEWVEERGGSMDKLPLP